MDVADFFGIATGTKMPDKFERTGYHASKSAFVNAPVIDGFPVVMECELAEVSSTDSFYAIVGRIVNTAAEESVLSENGRVDRSPKRFDLRPVSAWVTHVSGEQVGKSLARRRWTHEKVTPDSRQPKKMDRSYNKLSFFVDLLLRRSPPKRFQQPIRKVKKGCIRAESPAISLMAIQIGQTTVP